MENEWVSDGNEKAASLLGVTSRWITHHAQAVASLQQHSDTRRSWTGVKAADDEAETKKHFITGSHLDSWGVRLRGRWWWIFGQIVMKHFDFSGHHWFFYNISCLSVYLSSLRRCMMMMQPVAPPHFITFCFYSHRFCSFTPETVVIAGGGSGCFWFRAADFWDHRDPQCPSTI